MRNGFIKHIFLWLDDTLSQKLNFEILCHSRGINTFPRDFRLKLYHNILMIDPHDKVVRYATVDHMYWYLKAKEAVILSENTLEGLMDDLGYPKVCEPKYLSFFDYKMIEGKLMRHEIPDVESIKLY